MQKYLLILLIFLSACSMNEKQVGRYSEAQIAALHLDSTKILSAETDSTITVDLNPFLHQQHFDFGSLVKEIKLIPLETTDESLLDDIRKIFVTDSNIFIHDDFKGGGIVIFDNAGKFIKRIPHGPGPGEIFRLWGVDCDRENHELIAYQHPFLYHYSTAGKFIRREQLPFGFYNFTVIPGGYIFKTLDRPGNNHLGHLDDYTLLVTDKSFKLKSVGLYLPPLGKYLVERDYLHNNQIVSVTQLYTDTIYQYVSKTEQLKVKYVLDYNKKKLPESYLHCNTFNEFEKIIRQNDYYYYNGRYLETTTHNVFFLENMSIGRTVIYRDKQSGNLKGGTNADYNINEIPPTAFPVAMSGDWLIEYFLPSRNDTILYNSSIISPEDKLKIQNLKEDDNPVLVLFQLKDF